MTTATVYDYIIANCDIIDNTSISIDTVFLAALLSVLITDTALKQWIPALKFINSKQELGKMIQ